MKKYSLHWTIHPEKDMTWYERQKSRMSSDEVARELDINYALSMSNRVFHEFNATKHLIREEPKLDKSFPIYRIWDFGKCNAVLYAQVDGYGRKLFFHERVLGKVRDTDDESGTVDQAHVAVQDSQEYKGFEFVDICDPQGSYTDHRGESTDVSILNNDFDVYPEFEQIIALPKQKWNSRGFGLIKRDLQFAPGGEEAFKIYVSQNGKGGCPVLLTALQGAYCFKTDAMGNITDRIKEPNHPYEEVVDCMKYLYLQTNGMPLARREELYIPTVSEDYESPYLGY